jgi:hypothetical protein
MDVGVQCFGDRFEGVAQVTVVLDRFDQGDGDHAIALRQRAQVQLPQQVVLQRFAFGDLFGARHFVVGVGGAGALVPGLAIAGTPVDFGGGQGFGFVAVFGRCGAGTVRMGVGIDRHAGFCPVQQGVGFHRLRDFDLQFRRR